MAIAAVCAVKSLSSFTYLYIMGTIQIDSFLSYREERRWVRWLFGSLKIVGGIMGVLLVCQSLCYEYKCIAGAILGLLGACASFYGAYNSFTGKCSL